MEKENTIPEFAYNFELRENRRLNVRVKILEDVISRWMNAPYQKLLPHCVGRVESCPCNYCKLSRLALDDLL